MHDLHRSRVVDMQDGHMLNSVRSAHFRGSERGAYVHSAHLAIFDGLSARKPSEVPLCDPPLYSSDQILLVVRGTEVKNPNEVRVPRELVDVGVNVGSLRFARDHDVPRRGRGISRDPNSNEPVKHG